MKTILPLIAVSMLFSMFGCSKSTKTMAVAPFAADTVLTAQEIADRVFSPAVMMKMGRLSSSQLSPDGQTLMYLINYQSVSKNKSYTALWTMNMASGEYRQITSYDGSASEPTWAADGSKIYFMSTLSGSNQLHSVEPNGDNLRQITSIEGGVNGYGVSPTGQNVWLAMDADVQKVSSAQVYDSLPKSKALIYDDLMVRHWDRWEDGKYSHIFVGQLSNDGGKVSALKDIMQGQAWDAPVAPYFDNTEIAWNNAGTALAYTCRKLVGYNYAISTNTDIFLYTLADSTVQNLTEGMQGYDKYPRFSPDDTKIAWQSMERAGNESDKDRLMVLDIQSGEQSYLTEQFDYNASNAVWSSDGSKIYFLSPIEATVQVCEASLAQRSVRPVTQGLHDYVSLSIASGKVVAEKTTLSMAAEAFSIDLATGKDTQITTINQHIYDNVDMATIEKRMVRTTDGLDMLTWVIKPPKFDSTKKYPTLLYCQGGPQSVVSQAWSYRWNYQLMANAGYVVVAPNRRGLPSFGQKWLDQISGDYSGQNIKDLLSAIDDVSKEKYVDIDKRGCVGASYGGYSVFYLAGHHDNRFKAFISHCGIFDFTSMYGSTEELWFVNNDYGGAYWDFKNPTAMRSYANSPHNFVQKWNTPIMIITGLKDYRIPFTQSLEAFTAAKALGLDSRLMVFEDEAHQVFKPQNAMVWHTEFLGWLDKYLK
ncbi:MAG: S9 family peptidase [Mucinivorans sp.]